MKYHYEKQFIKNYKSATMKANLFIIIVAMMLAGTSCSNSEQKDAANSDAAATNGQTATVKSAALPQGMENIVGQW